MPVDVLALPSRVDWPALLLRAGIIEHPRQVDHEVLHVECDDELEPVVVATFGPVARAAVECLGGALGIDPVSAMDVVFEPGFVVCLQDVVGAHVTVMLDVIAPASISHVDRTVMAVSRELAVANIHTIVLRDGPLGSDSTVFEALIAPASDHPARELAAILTLVLEALRGAPLGADRSHCERRLQSSH
jgi:hypothetical protein